MPERLKSAARLEVGDVLLVEKELVDKKTGKPFTWRFFAIVAVARYSSYTQVSKTTVIRLGDESREPRRLFFTSPDTKVYFLSPEEWPDGVHALRMQLILEGDIDIQ